MSKLETRLAKELRAIFKVTDIEVRIVEGDHLVDIITSFRIGENNFSTHVNTSYSYLIENYGDIKEEIAENILVIMLR